MYCRKIDVEDLVFVFFLTITGVVRAVTDLVPPLMTSMPYVKSMIPATGNPITAAHVISYFSAASAPK